jgi:hypothetical protein
MGMFLKLATGICDTVRVESMTRGESLANANKIYNRLSDMFGTLTTVLLEQDFFDEPRPEKYALALHDVIHEKAMEHAQSSDDLFETLSAAIQLYGTVGIELLERMAVMNEGRPIEREPLVKRLNTLAAEGNFR